MKYRNLFVCLTVIFLVIWMAHDSEYFRPEIWILFSPQNIYENYIAGPYFGAGIYIFILAIVSVGAVEYCTKIEEIATLVRFKSRMDFFSDRFRIVMKAMAIYTLVYYSVGFTFSAILFKGKYVFCAETAMFYASSMLLSFIVFVRINVIYLLLRDVVNRKTVAVVAILAILIIGAILGYYIADMLWIPCKDLEAAKSIYFGEMGVLQFILTVARQIGMTILTIVAALYVFERRDVMRIEK